MIKKFSFWMVVVLVALLGSMVLIHWKALRDLNQRTAIIQPLYQREKLLDSLSLSLERYRRLSAGFRKLTSQEIVEIKGRLKNSFKDGVSELEKLDSTSEERMQTLKMQEQIEELLVASARIEPMLFSQDAYTKSEIQEINNRILFTLSNLEKSTEGRIASLKVNSSRSDAQSAMLLLAVGGGIFLLFLGLLMRDYFIYVKPVRRLHSYAKSIHPGVSVPNTSVQLTGVYAEIQSTLHQLAQGVETYMRDRHKFILDVVADLKTPLVLLQAGKHLLSGSGVQQADEAQQIEAAESVRRGLAIFSGSLDDLNDLVDFNRLESSLEETTVDLSDILSDVSRTVMGVEFGRKMTVTVPPIPVWVLVDAKRLQRVLVQLLSKVISTVPKGGSLVIGVNAISHGAGTFRGVEIVIQDADRTKSGRAISGGPEQDILKHWISETGLSMTLAHKIIKAHGGTLTAAGVVGTSVTLIVRIPQERIMSRGLISPPSEELLASVRGLVIQKPQEKKEIGRGEK